MNQLPSQPMNPVVRGGDHQARVQVKALPDARTDRRKSRDLRARAVIDFGGIRDDQETFPFCLLGQLPVGSGNGLKCDFLTVKEIVGRS